MTGTVLILGAHGRFGRNAAQSFAAAGWAVQTFDRRAGELAQAARGADVIVAAWNPPYQHWARQMPGQAAQIQEAARASGAMVILPGNVYVYGQQTPPPWREDTPHGAGNPLGRIRIALEQSYSDSGVKTVVLHGGDFVDTATSGNWLDRMMLPTLPKGRLTYPGAPDIPHAWAFLPDLARAAVQLAAQRATLEAFTVVNFPGYRLSGNEMAEHLRQISCRPVELGRMSWLPLRLAAPFWPMARCLLEMRYLWDTPHWLESDRFAELCPGFQMTAPAEALAQVAAPWLPGKAG